MKEAPTVEFSWRTRCGRGLQVIPSVFVPAIERAVQEFVAKWQDRDESMNFAQRYDPDLVKDELRPLVFEEIRLQVDEEMRILLENLKVPSPLTTTKCASGCVASHRRPWPSQTNRPW